MTSVSAGHFMIILPLIKPFRKLAAELGLKDLTVRREVTCCTELPLGGNRVVADAVVVVF